jgi:hypothetical protein
MKANLNKFQVEKIFYDKKFGRIAAFVKLLSGKVEVNSILLSERTGCKYKITGNGFISAEADKKGFRALTLRLIDDHENQDCALEVGEILSSTDKL